MDKYGVPVKFLGKMAVDTNISVHIIMWVL